MTQPEISRELQKALHRLIWATGVLYLVVAVSLALVWRDSANKRNDLRHDEARTARSLAVTNGALCALRRGQQDGVKASEEFLAKHPQGIPGVPEATVEATIARQRLTISSLSSLRC